MKATTLGLIVLFALSLLTAPRTAQAQQGAKLPRVALLQPRPFWEAFREGLHHLGYIEGQNIALTAGWAEGSTEQLLDHARALVRHHVDVIVTWGTAATRAAKQATETIPIVM